MISTLRSRRNATCVRRENPAVSIGIPNASFVDYEEAHG